MGVVILMKIDILNLLSLEFWNEEKEDTYSKCPEYLYDLIWISCIYRQKFESAN